jgi:hypothetical protein
MGEGRRRLSGYRRAQTNQSARDRSIARRAEASHGEPWLPAGVRSVRVDWQVQCLFVGSTELEGGSGAPRMAEASRGNLFSRRPVERSAARSRHFIAAGINAAYARRGSSDSSLPTELPVIGALAARRWCAEVLLDAESALAWCDRCSTRAGALEELARPERNGPRIGSEAYAHIEHYVRAHAVP